MEKILSFRDDARAKATAGLNTLYDAVASTLGPGGRNVLISYRSADPFSTKDGVTVARNLEISDEFQNAAIKVIKQAAQNSNTESGDGTTSATVLTKHIFDGFVEATAKPLFGQRVNPHILRKEIEKVAEDLKIELAGNAMLIGWDDVELTRMVATISGNSSEVGQIVSDAYFEAGELGSVVMKTGTDGDTELVVQEGYLIDTGYEYPDLYPQQRSVNFDNPLVIVFEGEINDPKKFAGVCERIMKGYKSSGKPLPPLLFMGGGIVREAYATLKANIQNNNFQANSVLLPYYGPEKMNQLQDLASYVGGGVITQEDLRKPELIDLEKFGTCKVVNLLPGTTIISGGNKETIEERVEAVKLYMMELKDTKEIEEAKTRLSRLNGKFSTIHVGSYTHQELSDKIFRYEDAVSAVKCAISEGVVPGGGFILKFLLEKIKHKYTTKEEKLAWRVLDYAATNLFSQILSNLGYNRKVQRRLLNKLLEKNSESLSYSYDYATLDIIPAQKIGVYDPVKVVITSLESAVSSATVLGLTDCIICEEVS